jgi:hypothetical protein
MRATTVNDVFYSLVKDGKLQVKDVLQYIDLKTNHRKFSTSTIPIMLALASANQTSLLLPLLFLIGTHAQNLAFGQTVRRILERLFQIPMTNEKALINGDLPKTMMIKKIRDLADTSIFQGGNIVFVAPDEKVHELRLQFQALEIHNDVFGVREAKGLEFDACALLGFFGHLEELGSKDQWLNVLKSLLILNEGKHDEKVDLDVTLLAGCDYRLSCPNVSDEAMMLYTALTRARNHLYLIELENTGKGKKQGKPLAQFAFRRLKDLRLTKQVSFIKEGHVEMTPAEHKARGVLYVTQALNMSRNMEPFSNVKNKFTEAMSRFAPDKGNDKELLDKCEKHLDALTQMHSILKFAKENFLRGGGYNLEGRFAEVLEFEQMASEFFSQFLCDSFLVAEIHVSKLLGS